MRRKGYEKPVTNTVLLYTESNKMDEEVWLAAIENKLLGKYFIVIPQHQRDFAKEQGEKVLEHDNCFWKKRLEYFP